MRHFSLRPRVFWLLGLGMLLPLIFGGGDDVIVALAVYYAALAGAVILDGVCIGRKIPVDVRRMPVESFTLDTQADVGIAISNPQKRPIYLTVRDTPSHQLTSPQNSTISGLVVPPGKRTVVSYSVRPCLRGDAEFGRLYARVGGPLRWVCRDFAVGEPRGVQVFPNQREAEAFTLLAQRNRLHQAGVRSARLQGVGREFESLRDYLPDDEMRHVDWKATARRGHLVSRQYESERSQTLILLVDIGRTMRTVIGSLRKLDYAISAILLLARVATQSDDRVGLVVFSDQVHCYIPPNRGHAHLKKLVSALYNLDAGTEESDYRAVIAYLDLRWRKRALIVCFTDLWDPDSSRETIKELAQLRVRHLPIVVTIEDSNLETAAKVPALNRDAMFYRATALQMRHDRYRAIDALRSQRIAVLDAPADKLSVSLVNQYLKIKRDMLL